MATEHQTLDAPGNFLTDEAQRLTLLRASHLLRMLQHAARAARLESHVVELESELEKARAGDVSALKAWLDNFELQPGIAAASVQATVQPVTVQPATVQPATVQPATVEPATVEPDEPLLHDEPLLEQGWSAYLFHARRRLDAIKLQRGNASPWLENEPSLDVQVHRQPTYLENMEADVPEGLSVFDQVVSQEFVTEHPAFDVDSTALDDECANGLLGEPLAVSLQEQLDEQLSPASLACLGDLSDLRGLKVTAVAQPLTLRKRIFGSYGLSTVGHVIVLVILGTITYQSPSEGNSLGSQVLNAAEASGEPELTHEIEMHEPSDLQNSEPIANSTPDTSIASELSQLSQSVSPVTVDASVSGLVGSSIASAITEATGKSGSGSRGSGVPSLNGSFFGVGTGGNYFCYVVDRSGSMRGGAWESAKAELLRSLKSLKATQKFYIVFFADEFEALPEPGSDQPATSGLYATPDNIDHARRWIQSVQLNRGGPPNEALTWAIEREPDAIYLLTDGVTKVDVCGFLRKANRIEDVISGSQVRVPIHAVAYHSLEGQQLMRQLAKENKGQFIYVPKPKK